MDLNSIENQMQEAVKHLEAEFVKVRTGRANPAMLDAVKVVAYGSETPINQVALINVPEARQLVVKPFDPSLLKEIEAGINKADIGINPTNDGEVIRLNIPSLTEESRKLLTKETKELAENAKVSVRNIRKNANNDVKKDKETTEDDKKQLEQKVQDLTNKYNKIIEEKLVKKDQEIMTI